MVFSGRGYQAAPQVIQDESEEWILQIPMRTIGTGLLERDDGGTSGGKR